MEKQIRDLCSQLLVAKDPRDTEEIGNSLRSAIHQQVQDLRHEVEIISSLDALAV